ncbi:hypothetical protein V8C35DRAFT_284261 [Trichoderma chlorosporum]
MERLSHADRVSGVLFEAVPSTSALVLDLAWRAGRLGVGRGYSWLVGQPAWPFARFRSLRSDGMAAYLRLYCSPPFSLLDLWQVSKLYLSKSLLVAVCRGSTSLPDIRVSAFSYRDHAPISMAQNDLLHGQPQSAHDNPSPRPPTYLRIILCYSSSQSGGYAWQILHAAIPYLRNHHLRRISTLRVCLSAAGASKLAFGA